MLLRPETPITPLTATITIAQRRITLLLPARNERFIALARALGFTWNRSCWARDVREEFAGPTLDRAVEAAVRLLAAGFIVEVPGDLAPRVLASDYAPEHTRWISERISSDEYRGWLNVRWARHEDFYQRARRLHGSRYVSPLVVVPPDSWAEVLDFAQAHDFRLSAAAQQVIAQARARYEAAVLAIPTPRPPATQPTPATAAEVHPELYDDDELDHNH